MTVAGIINILKPPGMTSHDVVNLVRKIYKTKKVGHTGTLDPGAAGVLPITVGRATKISRFIAGADKMYRAEVTLGIKTDTQDAEGNTIQTVDASFINKELFTEVLYSFKGEIQQVPPMASAVKIGGKKLYELHRQGLKIERPVRNVEVYDVRLVWSTGWGTPHPRALFDILCSKGTYIRTICNDLGDKLGVGAHMSFLLRTRVGQFSLAQALTIEELQNVTQPCQVLASMDDALVQYPVVKVRKKAAKSVISGSRLYPPGVKQRPMQLEEGQLVRLKDGNELLALAKVEIEIHTNRLVFKPVCILKT